MSERIKYFRTYHLLASPGCINDDKQLSDEAPLFSADKVVITEKMDGENFTGYWNGDCHARSIETSNHPSRNYAKAIWRNVNHDLPKGWRVCAENLYAKHSIFYKNLTSYLQVFSIWDENNICLDWSSTELWCKLLGLETVPVIYKGAIKSSEDIINFIHNVYEPYCQLPGDEKEGFVIRNFNGFSYDASEKNIAKFVRSNHVQTSEHWLNEAIVPNELRINQ